MMSTNGRMAGVMWRGTVPSMTLNCSPVARSLLFPFMQSDGVEVGEEPGTLHDSELCRLLG